MQYAVAAAQQALEQANLDLQSLNKERLGVYIGSGIGGINTTLDVIRL